MAETQKGKCKPIESSLLVIPSHDGRIVATIWQDVRQKWEYEVIPNGEYRLHRDNVSVILSREWFTDGWEIVNEKCKSRNVK